MIRKLTDLTKKKFIVINIAYEIGICKTAELFNLNRRSIRNWITKYEKGGLEELQNKSRQDQLFESKMPKKIVEDIIRLKKIHPEYSVKKIKEVLNLNYSVSTIYKKLKLNNQLLKIDDKINTKKNSRPNIFSDFFVSIKKIKYRRGFNNEKFPKYLILIEEKAIGITFCSSSNERTSFSVAIFLEYFIENLKQYNFCDSYNFHISSSIKLSSNDLIVKIVQDKYQYNVIANSYMSDFCSQRKVIPYKYLYNSLFSKFNSHNFTPSFAYKVFSHLLLFNFKLFNDIQNNSLTKPTGICKEIEKLICNTFPIITDKFISNLTEIKNNSSFFKLDYLKKSVIELSIEIKKITSTLLSLENKGVIAQKKYKYNEAEESYSAIISLSKSFLNKIEVASKESTDKSKLQLRYIIESLLNAILGLITIYKVKGMVDEERSLLTDGIKYSSKYKFHEFKMKFFNELADLDVAFQNREKALKLIKFVIRNESSISENYLRAKMLLGNYYKGKDNINIALKIYSHVLDRIEDRYPILKVLILTTIARTYLSINRFEDTKLYCEKAIETSKYHHIDIYDIKIQDHLGVYYFRIDDFERSIQCFKKAIKLSSERNDVVLFNRNTVLLANVYHMQGKYDKAISIIKSVLPSVQKIKDHETEIRSLQSISKIYLELKKYKVSEDYADKAIFLADYLKDHNQYILSLICKINIHFQKFNLKKIIAINQIFIRMNDRIEYTSTKSIVSLINKRVKALKL